MRRVSLRLPPLPGLALSVRALGVFAALLALGVGLAVLIASVDGGSLDALSAARFLGPVAWAAAVASAVGRSVVRGEWSGWMALGQRPRSLLVGLLILSLVGASTGLGRSSARAWSLPSPVDEAAVQWPTSDGWSTPELGPWQRAPGTMAWGEVWARSRADGPAGRRVGVDRGELSRRAGQAAAWPLGMLLGLWCGRRMRRTAQPLALAAAAGAAGVGLWLLLIAVLSAAQASTIT